MKHSFFTFTLISALSAVGFMSSCQPEALPSLTEPNITVAEFNKYRDTLSFSWIADENAVDYTYILQDQEEVTTTETSVTFTGLPAGVYTLKVRANVAEGNATWANSQFAEVSAELVEPFKIEITDILSTSATTITTPDDKEMYFFVDVLEKEKFMTTFEGSYMNLAIKYLSEWQMIAALFQKHPAEYAEQGVNEFTYDGSLYEDTDYISFAFGIYGPEECDGQGNIIKTRITIGPEFRTAAGGAGTPRPTNSIIKKTL